MACFIVPLVQAVATTVYRKRHAAAIAAPDAPVLRHRLPDLEKMLWGAIAAPDAPVLRHRLPDLEKMLWGGTLMLIVDHIINGELTWRFPFFTALDQAGGGLVMLREMLTVGVPMSLVLTAAWLVWALVKEKQILSLRSE